MRRDLGMLPYFILMSAIFTILPILIYFGSREMCVYNTSEMRDSTFYNNEIDEIYEEYQGGVNVDSIAAEHNCIIMLNARNDYSASLTYYEGKPSLIVDFCPDGQSNLGKIIFEVRTSDFGNYFHARRKREIYAIIGIIVIGNIFIWGSAVFGYYFETLPSKEILEYIIELDKGNPNPPLPKHAKLDFLNYEPDNFYEKIDEDFYSQHVRKERIGGYYKRIIVDLTKLNVVSLCISLLISLILRRDEIKSAAIIITGVIAGLILLAMVTSVIQENYDDENGIITTKDKLIVLIASVISGVGIGIFISPIVTLAVYTALTVVPIIICLLSYYMCLSNRYKFNKKVSGVAVILCGVLCFLFREDVDISGYILGALVYIAMITWELDDFVETEMEKSHYYSYYNYNSSVVGRYVYIIITALLMVGTVSGFLVRG